MSSVIEQYLAEGRVPWAPGYGKFKNRFIADAMADASMMRTFRQSGMLPENFGARLDERVVEYPWTISRLGEMPGYILDAGSVYNCPLAMDHAEVKDRRLMIFTLLADWITLRPNVSYVFGDLRDTIFKDGTFEVIVCISTLEHIGMIQDYKAKARAGFRGTPEQQSYLEVLGEFRRLLKPGGSLLLTVPYGVYEDHGWLQQFDAQMLDDSVASFGGRLREEVIYRYDVSGWQLSSRESSAKERYYNIHSQPIVDSGRRCGSPGSGVSLAAKMTVGSKTFCIAAELSPVQAGGVETNLHSLINVAGRMQHPSIQWKLLSPSGSLGSWLKEAGPHFGAVTWPHGIAALQQQPRVRSKWAHSLAKWGFRKKLPEADPFDALLRENGVDGVHFPYSTAFPTTLPSVYEPWDLQHRHIPAFFSTEEIDYRERTYWESCRRAKIVVTATRYTKDDVVRQYGISPSKIAVIPRSSLQFQRRFTPEERDEARRRHGLPEHFLFYPAMTFQHKNHRNLFRALRILQERYGLDIPLLCSGRPHKPYHATVLAAAKEAGVDQRVSFLGKVDSDLMCALFASADLLVFPSLFEGLGLPVLEAFHHGLPVACARTTCLPEVVGDAALLFDAQDPASIAQAISEGVTSRERREQLINAGRERLKHFAWEVAGPKFFACYKSVLGVGLSAPESALVREIFS